MRLLLVGATGLVGQHVLELALCDERVSSVTVLARQTLNKRPKLSPIQVDFENLPKDASWWQADAVICTLGTTMKKAGSKAVFRRVDYDYPLIIAQLAHAQGTPTYVLNSAIGADISSPFFYNRVKGELEQSLTKEGFESLTLVRPGVIDGNRNEFRVGEKVMVLTLKLIGPLLPKRWRLNPASSIAKALLEAAINPVLGKNVITSEQLL